MNMEEVILLAQLLNSLREDIEKLDAYYRNRDLENLNAIKREILILQKEVDKIVSK